MKKKVLFLLLLLLIVTKVNAENDLMKKIRNGETITIKSVEPSDDWGEEDYYISNYLTKELKEEQRSIWVKNCKDIYNCTIEFLKFFNSKDTETFDVKLNYKSNPEMEKQIQNDKTIENLASVLYSNTVSNHFVVEDLNLIDYYYNMSKYNYSRAFLSTNLINYSPKFKEYTNNSNLNYFINIRLGDIGLIDGIWGGPLGVYYNDTLYKIIETDVYVDDMKIIYIDESTEDTPEAYINAAKKRIDGFYGKNNIEISNPQDLKEVMIEYLKELTEEENGEYEKEVEEMIETYHQNYNILDYVYDVNLGGKVMKFVIAKDNSKTAYPEGLKTIDYKTNLQITSDDKSIPMDSKIIVDMFKKNEERFKKIKEIIKDIEILDIIDIKLFSLNANKYITKLDNGSFNVKIPLKEEYKNSNLKIYYINDDGTKEEYEVRIEDNYLAFNTNHFSTYIIGKDYIQNPMTSDNILINIIMMLFALVIMLSSMVLIIREKINLKAL